MFLRTERILINMLLRTVTYYDCQNDILVPHGVTEYIRESVKDGIDRREDSGKHTYTFYEEENR